MKVRKGMGMLVSFVILGSSCFVCSSCEDMFTAENQLVTTNLAPQDTVYQMMGIIKRMQKLADRTVVLGEVRADLVTVNPNVASADIQQLYDNNVLEDNVYNKPADYYDVINNCNVYLAGVDSLLKSHGLYVYESEVCAAKTFRAWCYLELVKIYGSVPFVTEPVLTADAAEDIVNSGEKSDMLQILNYFIDDLKGYEYKNYNNGLRPKYGNVNYYELSFDNFFIPVRVLLAEMYLWRGSTTGDRQDYINAIRLYHDYLCCENEERPTRDYGTQWLDRIPANASIDDYYNSLFSFSTSKGVLVEYAGVMPCDTTTYYGTTNNLRQIFNSQYSNNYYPWVVASQRLKDISAAQDYCYYDFVSVTEKDTVYFPHDPNEYGRTVNADRYVGDLRYFSNITTRSNSEEKKYNSDVSDVQTYIAKYCEGGYSVSTDRKFPMVGYYRNSLIYLHLAEALNRAGFPETAYAILAHGLTYKVMNDRSIISQREFDELCKIKSNGLTFIETNYDEKSDIFEQTRNSFVVWDSKVFANFDKTTPRVRGYFQLPETTEYNYIVQMGIHSRGCGDTEVNQKYYLDDEETKKGLVDVPAKPKKIANAPEPYPVLEYEQWLSVNNLQAGAVNKANFNNYVKANADSLTAFNEYPALYAQYQADSTAYQDAVNANVAYLAQPSITAKRQARVAQLILDEEALEGSFEGYRFYDIMRYQKQENKFNAQSITLPEYIVAKYPTFNGATPWKDNMTGKPWYLTLPKR